MAMPRNEPVGDEVRVQVPLSAEVVRKIDELADRMQVGRGRMAAMLLEAGMEDHEWIIRVVTSDLMRPVVAMVKHWDKSKSKGKHKRPDVKGATA